MKSNNRGLIKTILLIVVAILILSFVGIDLENALQEPLVKKNLVFAWTTFKNKWMQYVYTPISNVGRSSTATSTPEN